MYNDNTMFLLACVTNWHGRLHVTLLPIMFHLSAAASWTQDRYYRYDSVLSFCVNYQTGLKNVTPAQPYWTCNDSLLIPGLNATIENQFGF